MVNHRILVISYSDFSGIRNSIVTALKKHGCDVVEEKHTLRHLNLRPFYAFLMIVNAVAVYGIKYKRYIYHTPIANWVHGKANQVIVNHHKNVNAVISLPKIMNNFHRKKTKNLRYAILTDHSNLLSKKIPDYGIDIPEQAVCGSWNKIERTILSEQDQIFVMGSFVKESMIKDYRIDPKHVAVIGGGPNLDVDAERDGIEKDFSQHNILFVGLEPERKGLPVLRQAFQTVRGKFPKAQLHVVGISGGSENGIIYHGKLKGEPLKKLFYSSQIFSLPSFREPFGVVFVEAMWAKTVCIGTNLGAMPEIIEDGMTGYIILPGDSVALAKRIIYLFNNPGQMKDMAERGYRRARKYYNWERSAQIILNSLFE